MKGAEKIPYTYMYQPYQKVTFKERRLLKGEGLKWYKRYVWRRVYQNGELIAIQIDYGTIKDEYNVPFLFIGAEFLKEKGIYEIFKNKVMK